MPTSFAGNTGAWSNSSGAGSRIRPTETAKISCRIFWQAFGIIVLAKLLFGGFGHHDHRHKDRPNFYHWHKDRDNEERPPGRTSRNWKSYRQYWKDEGRQAFEAYANQVEKEKNKETVVP